MRVISKLQWFYATMNYSVADCAVFFHLVAMVSETWDVVHWQWKEGEAVPLFFITLIIGWSLFNLPSSILMKI